MDIGHVTWRKASYSGANGGGCVEVGVWRKSSYSGDNGGACIEMASIGKPLVAVRDSRDPHGPKLAFDLSMWQTFVYRLQDRSL